MKRRKRGERKKGRREKKGGEKREEKKKDASPGINRTEGIKPRTFHVLHLGSCVAFMYYQ